MAAADWPPAPTYALPIIIDEQTNVLAFNPIWLEWFLRISQVLSKAGAGGGGILHNSLDGLNGGTTDEYYHLTAAQHGDVTTGAAFKTIAVAGEDNVVADSYSDTLTLVGDANLVITTDAGTKTITFSFAGSAYPPDGDYGDIIVSGGGLVWTVKAAAVAAKGYWSPITNGDPSAPELIFDSSANVVVAWTATP
jgi:hypothetical protein